MTGRDLPTVGDTIGAAGDTIVAVYAGALIAALVIAYAAFTWEQRTTRPARPARGRRRAHGPAVKGPRSLDRVRDNLRDDVTALVHTVSRRRREAAANRYTAAVLEQRIHEGAAR